MQTLDEIGISYNTDKASLFKDPRDGERKVGNDYLRHYDRNISNLRHEPALLIEMGIGYGDGAGSSIKMWEDYFTHRQMRIVAVDIEEAHRSLAGGRVAVEIGDCGSAKFLDELGSKYPNADVIIDDASHYWVHQVAALRGLFKYLKPGGLYIIEDIGTSFHESVRAIYAFVLALTTQRVGHRAPHPLDAQLPDCSGDSALLDAIDSLEMTRGTVVIRKKA
jgi:SAM-dependent methyltransferase